MKNTAELVDALGGTRVLCRALEIPETTVSSWKSRGTVPPPRHWSELIRIARQKGVRLTIESLAAWAAARDAEMAS